PLLYLPSFPTRRSSDLRILGEGFLPSVSSQDMPQRRKTGLAEIGLPYAADAAITRHLARFLRQQAAQSEHGAVRRGASGLAAPTDRKSTRLNSSHVAIS